MIETEISFGANLAVQMKDISPEEAIVITMPEPWKIVARVFPGRARQVIFVEDMHIESLRKLEQQAGHSESVIGIGGGSAIDAAKYVGWKRSLPVFAIPTIASVDAIVTSAVAVRKNNMVRYIGNKAPTRAIINFPIIQQAPKGLNRAGFSDILSIHTALYDWQLASQEADEVFDENIANEARALLAATVEQVHEIREVTRAGIELLINGFVRETELCVGWGNSRPEEGSEHFLAYNYEYITDKHFVHGELVALGILVMSHLQDNNVREVREVLEASGIEYKPERIGSTCEELRAALSSLREFAVSQGLLYSVINKKFPLPESEVVAIPTSLRLCAEDHDEE